MAFGISVKEAICAAFSAECKTEHGKACMTGMVLAFALAVAHLSTCWVRDVLRFLLVMLGKNPDQAQFEQRHDLLLILAPFAAMLFNILLLVWIELRSKGKKKYA